MKKSLLHAVAFLKFLSFYPSVERFWAWGFGYPRVHTSRAFGLDGSWRSRDGAAVVGCVQRSVFATSLHEDESLKKLDWSKYQLIKSDKEVYDMLERSNIDQFDRRKRKSFMHRLDTKKCNSALLHLMKSSAVNKGDVAVRLLQYMFNQSEIRPELKPDLWTLNTVLGVISGGSTSPSRGKSAAKLADDIFQEWKDLYRNGKADFPPDVISYNSLLSAQARARNTERAQEIFLEMDRDACEGRNDGAVLPDVVSYATVMHAYALEGNVPKVESIIQEMQNGGYVAPTTACYNEMLYAYSKSKTPSRAEEYLKLWLEDDADRRHVRPDVRSFNIVLHSLSIGQRPGSITRAERLFDRMPSRDSVSYTTLISSYCSRLSANIALQATEKAISRAWADRDVVLDASFISNVLYSLSAVEAKEMPQCAERLVKASTKQRIALDIGVYNALVYCWARSGGYDAARRARQILSEVEKHRKLKPNLKTYTNVLDCLAKSRALISLDSAKQIIQKMEDKGPKPNVHSYTALIQNYARSRLPYKALEASKILQHMKSSDNPEAWPNIVTYNAVLNAAEHSDPTGGAVTEEALKVACLTFEEIRTSEVDASHVTFGSFLGVLSKLMPSSSRQEIVGLVFRRACKEGQVSSLVLRKLKEAVDSSQQLVSLMQGYDEESIPDVWKANVREVRARDSS